MIIKVARPIAAEGAMEGTSPTKAKYARSSQGFVWVSTKLMLLPIFFLALRKGITSKKSRILKRNYFRLAGRHFNFGQFEREGFWGAIRCFIPFNQINYFIYS